MVNKNGNFEDSHRRFNEFYFEEGIVYNKIDFERRFQILRLLIERICTALVERSIFVECEDTTGKESISPCIIIIFPLHVLAHEKCFEEVDNLCQMWEASVRKSFKAFVEKIVNDFGHV